MGKRRRNKRGNTNVQENADNKSIENNPKRVKSSKEDEVQTEVTKSTPAETFETFISPISTVDFFSNYWEKKPLLITNSQQKSIDSPLFSRKIFETCLESNKLWLGKDVNVVKYDREKKQRNDPLMNGKMITVSKFKHFLDVEKATIQIHHPQRFQDNLWHLLEHLESYFGCLVGSNVYITPPNAQGLPPHHDDIEAFILQLEGEKRWRLYSPKVQLPQFYGGDFKEDDIGEPILDATLKPGDVLYFPRGTIHQAETSEMLSSHITISTYQNYALVDYLLSAVGQMVMEAANSNVEFRRGLPVNFISKFPNVTSDLTSSIESLLSKINCKSHHVPHNIIYDFMANRLPPAGIDGAKLKDKLPEGKPPNNNSEIRLKYPYHISVIVKNDDEQDAADKVNKDEKFIFLVYSVFNYRHSHMMRGSNDKETAEDENAMAERTLVFPLDCLEAIEVLRNNSSHFVKLSELPKLDIEKAMMVAKSLWSQHLLEIKSD